MLLNNHELNGPLTVKKKIQENPHDLRHVSTEELLKINMENVRERERAKSKMKENEMAKNMIRENKFEFHNRERILGLSEVPLEKTYDGRSNIK